MDLHVLVLDSELGTVHLNFLVRWVFDDHLVGNTLTNGTRQLDGLNFRVVLNSHLESVEEVLTRVLCHEGALELVYTSSECQEIEFVVFVALACDIESVSASDEKTRLCVTLDFPRS